MEKNYHGSVRWFVIVIDLGHDEPWKTGVLYLSEGTSVNENICMPPKIFPITYLS